MRLRRFTTLLVNDSKKTNEKTKGGKLKMSKRFK